MAMEEAAKDWGGPYNNGVFSFTAFSMAMCRLRLATSQLNDNAVHEILHERDDVRFKGMFHFQIKNYTTLPKTADIAVEEDE